MTSGGGIKASLAAKLLLVFIATSVVVGLVISGFEILQERDETIAARQREADGSVAANIDTLSLAVWAFDDQVIEVTARSLLRSAGIVHVEVIADDKALIKLDRTTPSPPTDYAWERALLRPGTAETIGTLRIWENYDDVRAQMARRAGILVATELAKILAASVLLFVVVYFMITRPLSMLAKTVQMSGGHGQQGRIAVTRFSYGGRDEVDALVDSINAANAEQRRHQAREASAGKMEALGRLAGGIAHDFNNILGAILGFAGLIKQDMAEGSQDRRFAERIIASGLRGKDLIQQIRTFARAEVAERRVIDLSLFLRQNESLLAASLPAGVRLKIVSSAGSLRVRGSESLLGQLLSNLCVNAAEAYGGRDGEVTVATFRAVPSDFEGLGMEAKGERFIGEIESGRDYVCLRVTDHAGGMSPEVLDRIFEPFFTTKGRHRGTGLGLAVVRGVFESHGGACHVKTVVGEGTVFSIYLPLYTGPAEKPAVTVPREEPGRGKERVLIVDDEPDIADMLSIGLARYGYETVGVTNPFAALQAFEENPAAWDVVITDEMMPGMRGVELIRRMKAIRPAIRTVLCTGYSDGGNEDVLRASGTDDFLLKPVDAAALAPRLRKLLEPAAG